MDRSGALCQSGATCGRVKSWTTRRAKEALDEDRNIAPGNRPPSTSTTSTGGRCGWCGLELPGKKNCSSNSRPDSRRRSNPARQGEGSAHDQPQVTEPPVPLVSLVSNRACGILFADLDRPRSLLGICFWRDAPETAVGPDRRAGKRGLPRSAAASSAAVSSRRTLPRSKPWCRRHPFQLGRARSR